MQANRKKILLPLICISAIVLCLGLYYITKILPAKKAENLYNEGKLYQAAIKYYELGNSGDSFQRCFDIWGEITERSTIAAGASHSVGVLPNSTVISTIYTGDTKYYTGQCDIADWCGIVAVAAGESHTVGLKYNGTVVSVGAADDGQCDTTDWMNIVAIDAAGFHTVGLKANGTVVATGRTEYGRCQVSDWKDIVSIAAGDYHTVGLKNNGTVVATEYTGQDNWYSGQCEVSAWKDIIQVSAGREHTVGLKSDGTVVATGDNSFGQCEVEKWENIIYVSAGWFNTVGIKADGTVVSTSVSAEKDYGQDDVTSWTNVVSVCADYKHTIGLTSNGSVLSTQITEMKDAWDSDHGQCDVKNWMQVAAYSRSVLYSDDVVSNNASYAENYVGEWYCSRYNSCNDMEINLSITKIDKELYFTRRMISPTGIGSSDLYYSVPISNTAQIYCRDTSAIYILSGDCLFEIFDNGRQNKYVKTK